MGSLVYSPSFSVGPASRSCEADGASLEGAARGILREAIEICGEMESAAEFKREVEKGEKVEESVKGKVVVESTPGHKIPRCIFFS